MTKEVFRDEGPSRIALATVIPGSGEVLDKNFAHVREGDIGIKVYYTDKTDGRASPEQIKAAQRLATQLANELLRKAGIEVDAGFKPGQVLCCEPENNENVHQFFGVCVSHNRETGLLFLRCVNFRTGTVFNCQIAASGWQIQEEPAFDGLEGLKTLLANHVAEYARRWMLPYLEPLRAGNFVFSAANGRPGMEPDYELALDLVKRTNDPAVANEYLGKYFFHHRDELALLKRITSRGTLFSAWGLDIHDNGYSRDCRLAFAERALELGGGSQVLKNGCVREWDDEEDPEFQAHNARLIQLILERAPEQLHRMIEAFLISSGDSPDAADRRVLIMAINALPNLAGATHLMTLQRIALGDGDVRLALERRIADLTKAAEATNK